MVVVISIKIQYQKICKYKPIHPTQFRIFFIFNILKTAISTKRLYLSTLVNAKLIEFL